MMIRAPHVVLLIGMALSSSAFSASDSKCFKEASSHYGVPEDLLRAISHVESRGNNSATNTNKNGSTDIGHMQINSYWLPKLAKYGITKTHLMNACTNTYIGAWILASNISRMGYGWKAVGAYNARNPIKAAIYTRKVAAALRTPTRKTGEHN
jgi:soluble lytic murein transglycosylase-like protein